MSRQSQEHLQQFAERYMSVWNETDVERRSQGIRELWAEDAIQFTLQNEYHGHQSLLQRITTNYEKFVQDRGLLFRIGSVEAHHDAVKLTWEMLPARGGEIAGSGILFLLLSDDGRIRLDYHF